MTAAAGGAGVLVWLFGVLVQLLADLDRGQSLRHRRAPWPSGERSIHMVAAERPRWHHPEGMNGCVRLDVCSVRSHEAVHGDLALPARICRPRGPQASEVR